jgi:c-di-GMP-binding flagellar brake protein YcgR
MTTIALSVFLFLLIYLGIIAHTFLTRAKKKNQESIAIINGCSAMERRKALRRSLPCKAFIKQNIPEGGISTKKFAIRDLSSGGLYVYTDPQSMFGLGEEIEVTIELGRAEYYAGKACVIHSQVTFDDSSIITESGIGMMFLNPPIDFIKIN